MRIGFVFIIAAAMMPTLAFAKRTPEQILADYAAQLGTNRLAKNSVDPTGMAFLRLANVLDSDNETQMLAFGYLKRGRKITPVETTYTEDKFARLLVLRTNMLVRRLEKDEKSKVGILCRAYLLVAELIKPNDKDVILGLAKLGHRGFEQTLDNILDKGMSAKDILAKPEKKKAPTGGRKPMYLTFKTTSSSADYMVIDVKGGDTATLDKAPTDIKSNAKWTTTKLLLRRIPLTRTYFLMGATDGASDERPTHKVSFKKGFWIGVTEVTIEQYRTIMGADAATVVNYGPRTPATSLLWDNAVTFCSKLTSRERAAGRLPDSEEYRLPTESEWEYCARGGGKSKGYKFSGSNNLSEVAVYRPSSAVVSYRLSMVAQKKPNELGLYDMSGNVKEYCYDWYGKYPTNSQMNPMGPSSGKYRVLRGGSYYDRDTYCRVAARYRALPTSRYSGSGFRIVRVPVHK